MQTRFQKGINFKLSMHAQCGNNLLNDQVHFSTRTLEFFLSKTVILAESIQFLEITVIREKSSTF